MENQNVEDFYNKSVKGTHLESELSANKSTIIYFMNQYSENESNSQIRKLIIDNFCDGSPIKFEECSIEQLKSIYQKIGALVDKWDN